MYLTDKFQTTNFGFRTLCILGKGKEGGGGAALSSPRLLHAPPEISLNAHGFVFFQKQTSLQSLWCPVCL